MNKWTDIKDKPKYVLYLVGGGYVFYQGVSILTSLVKEDAPLSKNLLYYIFAVIFLMSGTIIFYITYKRYKKQVGEMKNEQEMDSTDASENENGSDDNLNE